MGGGVERGRHVFFRDPEAGARMRSARRYFHVCTFTSALSRRYFHVVHHTSHVGKKSRRRLFGASCTAALHRGVCDVVTPFLERLPRLEANREWHSLVILLNKGIDSAVAPHCATVAILEYVRRPILAFVPFDTRDDHRGFWCHVVRALDLTGHVGGWCCTICKRKKVVGRSSELMVFFPPPRPSASALAILAYVGIRTDSCRHRMLLGCGHAASAMRWHEPPRYTRGFPPRQSRRSTLLFSGGRCFRDG